MASLNFNAQGVPPATGQLDAMPKGWYNAVIEESEMKPTSAGTGHYLELKFNIISGRFQGRKVFARLNLDNPNPVAKEIGFKELSAICHATGVMSVQDSAQLHNVPLKIRLKVKRETEDYEAGNEIAAYRNINEQVKLADEEAQGGIGGGSGMPPQQPLNGAPNFPPQQAPQQQQQQPNQYQQAPQQQAPQQQPWQGQQQPPQDQPPQMQQQQPQYQQPPQQQPPQGQQWQQGGQQPWQQGGQQQPPQDQPPQMQQQQPPQQQQQAPQGQPYNGAQLNPQQATPPWQQPPQQ